MTSQVFYRKFRSQTLNDVVGQEQVTQTLRNALAPLVDENALRSVGIDPSARGETLAVDDFVRLANAIAPSRESPPSFR